MIKRYFLDYDPYESGDLIMRDGGETLEPARSDIDPTGRSPLPKRVCIPTWASASSAVRHYLGDDEMFIANYGDQLSDLPLALSTIEDFRKTGCVAGFVAVRPSQSFHTRWICPNDGHGATAVKSDLPNRGCAGSTAATCC